MYLPVCCTLFDRGQIEAKKSTRIKQHLEKVSRVLSLQSKMCLEWDERRKTRNVRSAQAHAAREALILERRCKNRELVFLLFLWLCLKEFVVELEIGEALVIIWPSLSSSVEIYDFKLR